MGLSIGSRQSDGTCVHSTPWSGAGSFLFVPFAGIEFVNQYIISIGQSIRLGNVITQLVVALAIFGPSFLLKVSILSYSIQVEIQTLSVSDVPCIITKIPFFPPTGSHATAAPIVFLLFASDPQLRLHFPSPSCIVMSCLSAGYTQF